MRVTVLSASKSILLIFNLDIWLSENINVSMQGFSSLRTHRLIYVCDFGAFYKCSDLSIYLLATSEYCFGVVRQVRSTRQSVTWPVLLSLVTPLVLSKPDYFNATLASLAACLPAESGCNQQWTLRLGQCHRRASTTPPLHSFATYIGCEHRNGLNLNWWCSTTVRYIYKVWPHHTSLTSCTELPTSTLDGAWHPRPRRLWLSRLCVVQRLRESGTAHHWVCSLLYHFQSFAIPGTLKLTLFTHSFPTVDFTRGLRDCKNRAYSVSWPEVVKGVPNKGVDCFVS